MKKKSFLDKPCQFCGKTIREKSCAFEFPPKGKPTCYNCKIERTPKKVLEETLKILAN